MKLTWLTMKIRIAFSLGCIITLSAFAQNESVSAERMLQLNNLLKQDCGSCHGLLLKGGLGPELSASRLSQLPADFITDTILNGRPGTAMPGWKAILTEPEAAWIASQLQQGVDP